MLISNGARLRSNPMRYLFGHATPLNQMWANGNYGTERLNQRWSFGKLSSVPNGYYPPYCWKMPEKAGAMSAHQRAWMTFSGTANGAKGMYIYAAAGTSVLVDASALGGLIAGAIANAALTLSSSGSIVATISTDGTAVIELSAAATAMAEGWANATANVVVDGQVVSYALGHMEGTTEDLSGLTPESIAAAVWNALSTAFNEDGTMGNKLNSASSAGDPWNTFLPGSYAEGTAGKIVGAKLLTYIKYLSSK